MRSATYGAFSEAFHDAGGLAQLPLNGTIEVTHRCPLTCKHCYNNLPMSDRSAERGLPSEGGRCRERGPSGPVRSTTSGKQ